MSTFFCHPHRGASQSAARIGLVVVLLVIAAAWQMASPRMTVAADKPNVIFILADDLGWGDLGCYGHPHIKTPNLDRLARQGTLFTQFYVNGSVCSPSRTAFMTGNYPARHRVHGHFAAHAQNAARDMPDWLDPSVVTLPKLMKQAGYATAHFGKWHLGSGDGAPSPGEYGIDDHRTQNSAGPGWEENDSSFRARSTAAFVDETLRFIKAHREEPFYVNLWTLVPHATLNPTLEQMKPYAKFQPGNVPFKSAAQVFYASVTDLDAQIGRLLTELDALGLADNTLVIFSSDNGPEDIHIRNAGHSGIGSAGPIRGRKRSLYEGGVRVPFIVRWPGVVPAERIDDASVVAGVDLLPTVCQLSGAALPADYRPDGEAVADILRGTSRPRRRSLFWEWRFSIAGEVFHHSPMLAVREGNWKLLLNPDRSRVELYDIPADPTQLADQSEKHPELVERLASEAIAWQKTLPEGRKQPGAGQQTYPWPGKQPPAASRGRRAR
jgi:N-acetylgalactosamine-6-sulfatase